MKRIFAFILAAAAVFMLGCGASESSVKGPEQQQTVQTTPTDPPRTPEPVQTPEPTPAPYEYSEVFTVECEESINLRIEPSSRAELVRKLTSGERGYILGYDERYANVRMEDGTEGYVIAGFLRAESDIAALSIVTPTALYTYDEMITDAEALKTAYPNNAAIETVGESTEGREIIAICFGNLNATRHVLINAAMQGRAHMTACLTMAMAESYLASGGQHDVCFHLIPMANPDGVLISQTGEMSKTAKNVYKRDGKSGRNTATGEAYYTQWNANGRGVDINRNFDALWQRGSTTDEPSLTGYKGDAPESEAETLQLVAYTEKYEFDATLTYIASGSMIYYEFADSPANAASRSLAERVAQVSAYPLENDKGDSFGGYKDWALYKKGIPSLSISVGTRGAPVNETEFDTIWLRNRAVLVTVARWLEENNG